MDKMVIRRLILFAIIAVAGCSTDLITKQWIFGRLGNYQSNDGYYQPALRLVDGVFYFETHLNEGALFGIGQGRVALFAGLSIFAGAGVVAWLVWGGAARDRMLTVALGLISGGILGNLYDRLGLAGLTWAPGLEGHTAGGAVFAVRDWLHFKIDAIGFDWPIFNIADSLLVCGAALLVWHAFFQRPVSESESS